MKYLIIITLAIILSACTSSKKQEIPNENKTVNLESLFGDSISMDTVDLPILNLRKRYPKKEVILQDIANVEYIPLETIDSALVSSYKRGIITDNFIITYNKEDDICFFDRNGKFSHSFNKKGESGQEYSSIYKLRANSLLKEVYAYDLIKRMIQVYSFQGEYKRTLKLKEVTIGQVYNLDNDFLLVEDTKNVDQKEKRPTNPYPYYKMSIKDGTMTQIPLKVENRIGDSSKWMEGDLYYNITLGLNSSAYINDELVIADFGLDTVYVYKNDKLKPLAVKKNRIMDDIPILVTLDAMTDKYFLWYAVKKDLTKTVLPSNSFLQDRVTGKCIRIKFLDENITDENFEFRYDISANYYTVPKNHVLQYYPAERLIELNEAGKLKGELKEIASKLKVDDNPVLMLAKFKE